MGGSTYSSRLYETLSLRRRQWWGHDPWLQQQRWQHVTRQRRASAVEAAQQEEEAEATLAGLVDGPKAAQSGQRATAEAEVEARVVAIWR